MDEKSDEIPAVRELLTAFADLAGAVFTIDAMHTQHDTAQAILGRGADYVMTVKASMPTLYRQLKKLPWAAVPAVSAVGTDHGRRARRTIKAVLAPAWTGFGGAARVAQLRRTVTRNGRKTVRGTKNKEGKARTWSRRWLMASAQSSGRSPWTRNRTRSPPSGSC